MHISFVRRLDELGRIVIPKEVRNKLSFNSGDLLEMGVSNDGLVIKKCSSTFNEGYVNEIIKLVDCLSDYDLIITNTDMVIAKGSKVNYIQVNDSIGSELRELIKEHRSKNYSSGVKMNDNVFLTGNVFVRVLIRDSNTIGLVILISKCDDKNIDVLLNMLVNLLIQ